MTKNKSHNFWSTQHKSQESSTKGGHLGSAIGDTVGAGAAVS